LILLQGKNKIVNIFNKDWLDWELQKLRRVNCVAQYSDLTKVCLIAVSRTVSRYTL